MMQYCDHFCVPPLQVAVRPLFNASASSAPPNGFVASSMSCPFSASSPPSWSCSDPTLLLISIAGAGFGSNDALPSFVSDGVTRTVNLSWVNATAATVAAGLPTSWVVSAGAGPVTSTGSAALLWRLYWSDCECTLSPSL